MRVLLVVATEKEIFPFLKSLSLNQIKGNSFSFTKGNIIADILVTGVGMIQTCYHTTNILSQNVYDIALNVGLAGSFKNDIPIGTLVNVESDRFSEIGAEDGSNFLTLSEIDLPHDNEIPFNNGWLTPDSNKQLFPLQLVKGITVNTVHGNEKSIETIVKKFLPDVESMEGAAFFYSCMMKKVPCIQIRAISNLVERRNKNNWNIPLAIQNLNNFLPELLLNIEQT